ncbi:septum site-determining protein MinC [Salinisphaera sp.]|uniref:septum site-determining protein MinC n=1 Tax=Salinisphaera sp. TaxID=1914330 RepID=UPI002D7825F5|nr:septum site-determining protein MinC [Salinisphaera sp.]HET7312938.1 septum site-determining protein MinC [Salinisphaera sp.]
MAQTKTTSDSGVVFKGRMMTLTVLEIREADCDQIATLVDEQLARAPGFFTRLPVLLSLPEQIPDLARVAEIMTAADLVVVGVLDPSEAAAEAARAAGLGVITSPARSASVPEPDAGSERKPRKPAPKSRPAAAPEPEAPSRTPTRLITKPIRSGQQIYARGGDLVIATSVSEGAEVLADGHIHVYGALRGRALAGASGDAQARIYCKRFEPDLVAIAGCYKVADAMDEGVRSRPVQVRLENDNLLIELQE